MNCSRTIALLVLALLSSSVARLPAQAPQPEPLLESGIKTLRLEGKKVWVSVARVEKGSAEEARGAAEQAARAQLASSARSRIRQEVDSLTEESLRSGRVRSRIEFQSKVRASTDVVLQRAVLHRVLSRALRPGRYQGYAEVRILETDLFPEARLLAAIREGKAGALVKLAKDYEALGLLALAERALRYARDKEDTAELRLELGRFYVRAQDDAAALYYLTLAIDAARAGGRAGDGEAQPQDDPERKAALAALAAIEREARRRKRAIELRVPETEELVREVQELALGQRQPEGLRASARRTGGKTMVTVEVKEAKQRVLCTWIDDELVMHWVASSEQGGRLELPAFDLPLAWPPSPEHRPKRDATLILWALPQGHELWAELDQIRDLSLPIDGESKVGDRSRVRDVYRRLGRLRAPAQVLRMGR
jgi:hypothetical protein